MTDIQQARDVLAKWREAQAGTPWQTTSDWTGDAAELSTPEENPLGWMNHPKDARLIVGTAGNPAWRALNRTPSIASSSSVMP